MSEPAAATAAAPAPPPDAVRPAVCENCGTALRGAYCHACGQSAEPPTRSVRAFLRQAAADLTSLDSRLLRTLGLLIARPGRLTREYLEGRRVRYTQPLQLYLGCAAAFFFVNAYRPFFSFDPATGRVAGSLGVARVQGALDAGALASLEARGISREVFRERFEATVTGYMPILLIGSLLLFALALHLVHRRPRRGYLEHAVFSLHWSAFFLLLMLADRVLPQGETRPRWLELAILALGLAYLVLALRSAYRQPWPAAAIKAAGLFWVYQMLLSAWMASAIGMAFSLLL